ncbi:LOW QUALITY PROTEIN: uncharacterized protein EMH_0042660 [Eimeria mitis]|uniref:Uncharacterized protein n=1 Tax=Eimeria mitis TaxID=44415 RepID=U6JT96_9EIME|nr:LOW QUALITY PROTEIN: uncharacterized protein EMH_0042660 [Eimeria mitis]CDJ28644.1 hypothetical protein EMH_0042660 [Eimeria mitis]
MHRIELITVAAPSFVPRYRRPSHLEEAIERQAGELLEKAKVHRSTSAFGDNPVWVKKKDGRSHLIHSTSSTPHPHSQAGLHLYAIWTRGAKLQRQVNQGFWGSIPEGWMVIYMDDLLAFSRTEVEPDPPKIEAIQRWPLPLRTTTDVQKFVGLTPYYRNFIPGVARIAAPLTDLFEKNKQSIWTENEDGPATTHREPEIISSTVRNSPSKAPQRRPIGNLRSSPVL